MSDAPGWRKPLLIFMGGCTPGGFLFLLALLTDTHINFSLPIWYVMAGLGGLGGFKLDKSL